MNPTIQKLAEKLGTQIVDRDAFETWMFDGKTLANHYWVRPMDPPGTPYYFEPYVVHYDDVSLLHELGHWQAAKPEQKDLPEFGLAIGIADGAGYGPKGGEYRRNDGTLRDISSNIYDGLVDQEEQEIQESMAQLFSIFWGQRYGFHFHMKNWKVGPQSWKFYFEYKITQNDGQEHSAQSLQKTWAALIRFREMVDQGKC
jgi:hypothetical protein